METLGFPPTTASKKPRTVKKVNEPTNYDCPHCLVWININHCYRALNAHLQFCLAFKNKNTGYEHSRRNTRYGSEIHHQTESLQHKNLPNTSLSGLGVIMTDNQDEIIDDIGNNYEEETGRDELTQTIDNNDDMTHTTIGNNDDKNDELDGNHPSKKLLIYQQKLFDATSKDKLLRVRRHRLKSLNGEFEDIKGLTDADYIDLASIGLLFHNSESTGNILLKTLNVILKRHNLDKQLKFPECWRTIHDAIAKKAADMSTINVINIPIQPNIWGLVNKNNIPLTEPCAVGFDGAEIIAERCLYSEKSNIQCTPTYPKNRFKEDVVDSFFSGEICKQITTSIHNTYGERYYPPNCPNDHPGYRIMVIFVILSEDGAVVDTGRRKELETLKMDILNLTGTDASIDLLGIAPLNPLGMSFAEADDHLKTEMKCLQQFRRHERIKARKHWVHQFYHEQVHKSLRQYPNGAFLQLGLDSDTEEAETVVIFIETVALTGDSKALNPLCSVGNINSQRCRFCNETDCSRFTADSANWEIRDNTFMKEKTKKLGEVYEDIYLKNLGRNISLTQTNEEKELIELERDCNIIPGENWMYEALGDRMILLNATKGLHEMFPADRLHTVIKGPMENTITHTMDIVYLLGSLNNDKYGHIPSLIDDMFKNFPRKGSVFPFKLVHMTSLTKFFSKSRHKSTGAESSATNHLVGVISAATIPGISWTLHHVIGTDEEVLPKIATSIKTSVLNPNLLINTNRELAKWNIQRICQDAIQSCLNVLIFSSREDGFTKAQNEELKKIIALARAYELKLYNLRNVLKQLAKGVTNIILKKTKAYKQHLLEHLPLTIEQFGPPSVVDSQRTEHKHIESKGSIRLNCLFIIIN